LVYVDLHLLSVVPYVLRNHLIDQANELDLVAASQDDHTAL
jgi:hypothetical protein